MTVFSILKEWYLFPCIFTDIFSTLKEMLSSISTAIWLRTGQHSNGILFPVWTRIFLFSTLSRPGVKWTNLISNGYCGLFPSM
jgi:hypothetical protein